MRKNIIRKAVGMILLCVAVLGFTGCANGFVTTKYEFELSGFPVESKGSDVYVGAYQETGDYIGEEKLGTINSYDDVIKGSARFGSKTAILLLAIIDKHDTVQFAISLDPNKGPSFELNGYWYYNYSYEGSASRPVIGVCPAFFEELELGKEVKFDFTQVPYYIFKISNAKDKVYRIDAPAMNGVTVYASSDVEDVAAYSSKATREIDNDELTTNKTINFRVTDDTYYLLFRPEMYDDEGIEKTNKSAITITEITTEMSVEFPIKLSFAASDGTFFMTKEDCNDVYTYDFTTNKETLFHSFEKEVVQIEETDKGYYFVSGNTLSYYDKTTKNWTDKLTCDKNIGVIKNLENTHMFVISDTLMKVYDLETFTATDEGLQTKETEAGKKEVAPTAFYIPENKKIFYLQKGEHSYNSFAIYSLILTDDYKLDKTEFISKALFYPAEQIDETPYIFENYNRAYKLTDKNYEKRVIDSYNPHFEDFFVTDTYIYSLNNYSGDYIEEEDYYTAVYKFENVPPFTKVGEPIIFKHEIGKSIYADDKNVYILTNKYCGLKDKTFIKLNSHKITFDLKEDTGAERTAAPVFFKNAVDISYFDLSNFR